MAGCILGKLSTERGRFTEMMLPPSLSYDIVLAVMIILYHWDNVKDLRTVLKLWRSKFFQGSPRNAQWIGNFWEKQVICLQWEIWSIFWFAKLLLLISFYMPEVLLIVSGVKGERMNKEIDTNMRLCQVGRCDKNGHLKNALLCSRCVCVCLCVYIYTYPHTHAYI